MLQLIGKQESSSCCEDILFVCAVVGFVSEPLKSEKMGCVVKVGIGGSGSEGKEGGAVKSENGVNGVTGVGYEYEDVEVPCAETSSLGSPEKRTVDGRVLMAGCWKDENASNMAVESNVLDLSSGQGSGST